MMLTGIFAVLILIRISNSPKEKSGQQLMRMIRICQRFGIAGASCWSITDGVIRTSHRWPRLTISVGWWICQHPERIPVPEQAESETKDYFRLFMVPGMGHCAGGPGPDRFDALTALENWVENDVPPDSIIARKIEETRLPAAGRSAYIQPLPGMMAVAAQTRRRIFTVLYLSNSQGRGASKTAIR